MINWNDLTKLRNLEISRIDLPRLAFPHLPDLNLPVDADRVVGVVRDAAYASVGVVVVVAQQAVARRRELTDSVIAQARKVIDTVA